MVTGCLCRSVAMANHKDEDEARDDQHERQENTPPWLAGSDAFRRRQAIFRQIVFFDALGQITKNKNNNIYIYIS